MDNKQLIFSVASQLIDQDRSFLQAEEQPIYPDTDRVIGLITKIRAALFPWHFGDCSDASALDIWMAALLAEIHRELGAEIASALANQRHDPEAAAHAAGIASGLIERLADIQQLLHKDAEAAFLGDPAARGTDEVILAYPGFFAVLVYRVAHYLWQADVPLIPRIMSEHAHSLTGVDIHPGAQIGEHFFIDHGTGVVIGETTVVGDHVKLYQGVTLGALSTRGGQKLAGVRRHPTIEDNVTIYSGASILGGETVVGKNSTIGGNVFITGPVPEDSRVTGA